MGQESYHGELPEGVRGRSEDKWLEWQEANQHRHNQPGARAELERVMIIPSGSQNKR